MVDALREALAGEPDVASALLFGSSARGTRRPGSDADVAVELAAGAARDAQALGRLIARLESAAGRQIDLVLLDEAPVLPASSEAFATFRNLIAHQYGALDGRRVYVLASSDLKDLDTFCGEIARRAGGSA